MSGRPTVTMYISPEVDTVTVSNGGSYCMGGTGVHVGLNNSTSGVNYQLYNGITPVYSVGGNNSSLDFGGNYLTGTYSVIATNPVSGCMTTMFNTPTVFTNPLPTAYTVDVANSGVRCYGSAPLAISLSSSDFGITYQLYMGSTMIGIPLAGGTGDTVFGNYYTAGNYTVVATNQGTGCTSNMSGTATITVNPLPTAETVSGGGNYCAGSTTGTSVMLGGSQSGVLYSLMNGGSTIDTIRRSMGGAFNFPADTMTGYYTVQATSSAGCTSMMTGGTTILANPLPEMDTVTGGGAYCIGGSGQHVGLNFSSLGINYQLYYGGVATGSPVAGSNAAIDFGAKTAAGNYTVMATNITTSCSSAMSGPVTVSINPLPNAYSVTGGGSFCAGGTGVAVGIMTSNTGINYQLYNGATMVGSPVAGTGTTLSFGNQTNAGTYTVIGTNATTGCTMNMTGSEAVSINALPTSYNVTGGGNFCSGGTGVHIGINGSNTGVSYQLYNGTTMVGTAMTGTGSSLDFGAVTTGGSYTVSANNTTTFCSSDMGGSASVIVNPLPTVYTVTGGGNYCSGSTGVHVGLSGSNTGLSYQLYNGASMVGSPVTGLSGSLLDFGLITTPGTYTVDATNSITGCTSAMSGSKTIGINTLPMAYTVTGGGSVCAGAEGVAVNLSGSVTGINYILMNGGSTVNTLSGTGGALNFGLETTSGTYTVMASNPSTSCTSNMLSSANVVVNPLPDVYAVTGGGSYCSGGTGVNIGLIGSGYGINYQLMNGGTMVNVPVGGTGSALTFPGLFTMAGSYTVVASNTTTGCINNMSSSAVVTVTPTVIPSVAVVSASGDSVCEGTAVNYTATVTNGGTSPVYVWLVNGSAMGSGASFVYVPANGDMITAQITSNAACATPATVSSATTMTVINYVLPVANITAAPGSIVCPSTSVTYTATTENGGSAPYIAWLVDSAYTGDVSSSYTYTPSNGDAVMLMLVSNQKCRSMDTVYSHDILMTIVPPFTPSFSISSHLGPVIGVGQSDTLRALVTDAGILSLTYQWYINGNLVYGATTERLIADTVFNNDTVTCIVSGEGLCGTSSGTSGIRIHLENLGVQTVSVAGDIKLMPNPNKGDFTISGTLGTADNEEVTLEVTNMLGQVVYTDKVTATGGAINKHIQLNSGLANGMYLLNLRSESKNAVVHFVMEQ
jgi:hypothetical protein